jgi:hypothetical protein
MFQICVPDQKVKDKSKRYVREFFSKCKEYENQIT